MKYCTNVRFGSWASQTDERFFFFLLTRSAYKNNNKKNTSNNNTTSTISPSPEHLSVRRRRTSGRSICVYVTYTRVYGRTRRRRTDQISPACPCGTRVFSFLHIFILDVRATISIHRRTSVWKKHIF